MLWMASAVSTVGDGVRMAALPLLAAAISRDPIAVAAVSFAGQLPWLLTSLVAGAIADRLNRRTVMWTVDTVRALIVAGLAVMIVLDGLNITVLCAIAFLLGTGQTLFDSASQAVVPTVVPRSALASANGRLMTSRIAINSFVGPPLGGFLFVVSAALPFLVDAGSFVLAAVLVGLFLTTRGTHSDSKPAVTGRTSLWKDIGEGLRWISKHATLRSIGILVAVVNFTQAATQAILVLFATQVLRMEEAGFGVLLASSGIGGLVGGITGSFLRRWISPARLFAATILVTVPIFAILGTTSNALVAGLMLALNSFAGITASVLLQTLRQSIVPDHLMARVGSVVSLLAVGIGLPLGSVAGGLIADALGLRAPFLLSAVLIALIGLLIPRLSRAFAAMGDDRAHP
ncbi:MFS transporter [Nonomuraea sp. NPDC046802]|uniref:MFS transporter n=1 Tax=Nonomuraea sp. NPDC046802 TaxID=3154919 RepID=UPI0033E74D46